MLVPVSPSVKMPVWQMGIWRLVCEHACHTNPPMPAALFPPGAATLIADRPKLVNGDGVSTSTNGPAVLGANVGPVADTQATAGVSQNEEKKLPL